MAALTAPLPASAQVGAGVIGRGGDPFVFCYEGGDGGAQSQGWYPVNPATGTFVITRWCTGVPCPNWTTLYAYMALCPQARGMSPWMGPGGPGVIGQYRSSGGAQFRGDNSNPTGLSPMPH
jgi:hypothetical protein